MSGAIAAALPALRAALDQHGAAVLSAPPGAGKSTIVPLELLAEDWAAGRRLLLLEPRRLAARAVAGRMAASLGERTGETVGLRMRLETRVSARTRLEVVTEGVLTRMLQADPALEDFALVIFDEFHERSLQADLGLALVLDARAQLNPGLRVLVMSATLDTQPLATLLGGAPVIEVPSAPHPVDTFYAGAGLPLLPGALPAGAPWDATERQAARLTCRALDEIAGDVLVFLPGAREIRRVRDLLESGEAGAEARAPGVRVLPLYGELAGAEQDVALEESPRGTRRVILATNIAETSLTLPGIRGVVDSGLVRRSVFDPATGMSALVTRRIARSSADQRRGRAGRVAAGSCWRAWSEGAHASLGAHTPPEILEADLAPLALELAAWGTEAAALRWLDAPPRPALGAARDLLAGLGAVDREGRITAHGREMARVPLHPRLAHMLLVARDIGAGALAARIAALLAERDLLRGRAGTDADLRSRLELLDARSAPRDVEAGALARARRLARELEGHAAQASGGRAAPGAVVADGGSDSVEPGLLLALAWPDRVGRSRGEGGRFLLSSGRGARLVGSQGLARAELLVAAELDDAEREARILLAAPVSRAALEMHCPERVTRAEVVEWDGREQAVRARRLVRFGESVLEDVPLPQIPAAAAHAAMLDGLRELGLAALPWDAATRTLRARMVLVRAHAWPGAGWPDVSDAALLDGLDEWLGPWLEGITRREQLNRVALANALRALLSFDQQRELERLAPTHLTVPSGSRISLDWLDESAPVVDVRLQEVFGLTRTPRLLDGALPVTFRLLSPARRPVQVTRDLESFWRSGYPQVRKDLRGRYPRHYWPEDPLQAQAVRGVRRPGG